MNETRAIHGTITCSRVFRASPERLFAAWADETTHEEWLPAPEGMRYVYEGRDFTVGGRERCDMRRGDEVLAVFEHHYLDIVENRRVVWSVRAMMPDGTLISISKNTVEIEAEDDGARLVCAEQTSWFVGRSMMEEHEGGWKTLLDGLEAFLTRSSAS